MLDKSNQISMNKTLLKWAGNKTKLLPIILETLTCDPDVSSYYEPFLGSGALLGALKRNNPQLKCYGSDVNVNLITFYRVVSGATTHESFVNNYGEIVNHYNLPQTDKEKYYYEIRREFNFSDLGDVARSAYFLFLNKCGFNGLHRVNGLGKFNVPWGKKKELPHLDIQLFLNWKNLLRDVDLSVKAFDEIKIESNALYYLDPPYEGTFKAYHVAQYTLNALYFFSNSLNVSGAKVLISNMDTPEIRELFKDWSITEVAVNHCISGKASGRGRKKEVLIKNF